MINYLLLAAAGGLAGAEPTKDQGQFHHHSSQLKGWDFEKDGPVTVHIVPHSHDDVGWLKTVDEYFDGSNRDTQEANVRAELTNVMNEMFDIPQRTFTEVEVKFFKMWWDRQDEPMKNMVRSFVDAGRLEFVNGGWSMHDEACPTFDDMINNHMLGMDFLLKEFGVQPSVGWQIDPFGHSNANARLFAEMGFDAIFFSRLDFMDKEHRLNSQEMEFVWRPFNESIGKAAEIFGHVLYVSYSSPPGFDWDIIIDDTPWINDESSETYNGPQEAKDLMEHLDERMTHYKTSDLFVLLGDDFRYSNAHQNYINVDRMIDYMNEHHSDKYIFQYSTPTKYLNALKDKQVEWPVKDDDFFPYSDIPTAFWGGYYTSRPNDKASMRGASAKLHALNQLMARRVLQDDLNEFELKLMMDAKERGLDAQGINQHHDAITGTAKQRVADDYIRRTSAAIAANENLYGRIVSDLAKQRFGFNTTPPFDLWMQCQVNNGSYWNCPMGAWFPFEGDIISVAIQNPSSVDLHKATVAVPHGNWTVFTLDPATGENVTVDASVHCWQDYHLMTSTYFFESCHLVADLTTPAFDVSVLFMTLNSSANLEVPQQNITNSSSFEISNGNAHVEFKGYADNRLHFHFNSSEVEEDFSVELGYWESFIQFSKFAQDQQNSGDYIFRPKGYTPHSYSLFDFETGIGNATFTHGHNFDQFVFYFTNGCDIAGGRRRNGSIFDEAVILKLSLVDGLPAVQVDVDMGSLPRSDIVGYEVFVRFNVAGQPLAVNETVFFTDSNGLEMQKRIRDFRPTWDINENYQLSNQNISANYYPITSAIAYSGPSGNIAVVNDRSQGGSFYQEEDLITFEFMQNRRIHAVDDRGMDEYLEEDNAEGVGKRVPASYYLSFNSSQRDVQQRVDSPLQYFFNSRPIFNPVNQTKVNDTVSQDLKAAGVVDKVRLAAFPLNQGSLMLRLTNIADYFDGNTTYEVNSSKAFEALCKSGNAPSNTTAVCSNYTLSELALAGNLLKSDQVSRKIHWNHTQSAEAESPSTPAAPVSSGSISLKPQEIRVYNFTLTPPSNNTKRAQPAAWFGPKKGAAIDAFLQ